jgi:tRNA modification GTPase
LTETLVTRLTPAGTGAVATIGIHGPSAWEIARGLFQPREGCGSLPDQPSIPGRVWLGRFGEDEADEVVLTATGNVTALGIWGTVTIHCHGGEQVVGLLMGAIARRGARACTLAEYNRSQMPSDPSRALAEQRLMQAPTVRTAAILWQQGGGRFGFSLRFLLTFFDKGPDTAEMMLRGVVKNVPVGRHLIEPWKVVLAGAPNVGKSSLLNALAGYQRSIVAPTPGTTRDVVTTTVALDGWPVELADTAGLRQHTGAVEEQGIERARGAAAAADLCLWVLDAGAEPAWPDVPPERVLLVVNKVDLAPAWDLTRAAGAVHVSARTGAGLPELCDAVVSRLVPYAPGPGEAVPFTPELCDAVEEAYSHLIAGRIDDARRVLAGLVESSGR